MSQPAAKPHSVKVYGIAIIDGNEVLSVLSVAHFPSRCTADKFASEQRKIQIVTSASVYPTPDEVLAP